MMDEQVRRQIAALGEASQDELMVLLGAQALPLVVSVDELLASGREGCFSALDRPVLGRKRSFENGFLLKTSRRFLILFVEELRKACCEKVAEYDRIRRDAGKNMELAIVGIVGTLTAALPDTFAPYTGLILVLGVLIYQCGAAAFCRLLNELPSATETRQ